MSCNASSSILAVPARVATSVSTKIASMKRSRYERELEGKRSEYRNCERITLQVSQHSDSLRNGFQAAFHLAPIKILAEKAKPLHHLGTAQPLKSVMLQTDRLIVVVLLLQLIVALLHFQNQYVNMLPDE